MSLKPGDLVLGAQRLMGPKVVYFLREKFLSLLRPTILLCHKRQIIIRSITGNQNREIGEKLWRKIFKNFTQKPPDKNIQGAPRTQDRKNKKSHSIHMQMWLQNGCMVHPPANQIRSVNRTLPVDSTPSWKLKT